MERNRLLPQSANEMPPGHRFNGIDLVKFIGAYFVCLIHIQPFNMNVLESYNFITANFWIQQYLCRIAVPFYFVTSGYLLFRKIDLHDPDKGRIKGYCLKILRLLGIWSFLLFVGMAGHLWYLGATVLAVVLLYMLLKKGFSTRAIIIFAAVAFTIGLLGSTYYGLLTPLKDFPLTGYPIAFYDKVFYNTRNGVFFGFLYILMGALFAHKRIVFKSGTAYLGLAVSMALMMGELYLLKHFSQPKTYDLALMQVPVVFFLFYIAAHLNLKDRPIYAKMRVVGMLVFFLHRFVLFFVDLGFGFINDHTGINPGILRFLTAVTLTTLLAILIERLARTEKCRWLRYLYS